MITISMTSFQIS